MHIRRIALATALLLGASALTAAVPAAAAASPGTIVYIKGYNIWIANGDGSGQRPITTDGTYALAYSSPTQSDAGVIAAAYGPEILRMSQWGQVLNRMDPFPLVNTLGHKIDGNVSDAAISPDGSLISYSLTGYECENGCMGRAATAYTRADQLTPASTYGQTYYGQSSWVSNTRTLQTGGYGSHVMVHDLGQAPTHWFDDSDYASPSTDLGNTELSRDQRYLVGVRGYAETASIIWFRTTGAVPAVPEPLCVVGPATGITNPIFSPDSATIAWQENDGIYSKTDPSECSTPSVRIIEGGSQPNWSPAGMQPKPAVETPAPPVAPKVVNAKRPSIAGSAKVGRKLTASSGKWKQKVSVSYRWYLNGKPIKKATKRSIVIKKAWAGKRLTVKVTAKKNGWTSTTVASKAVRVKKR